MAKVNNKNSKEKKQESKYKDEKLKYIENFDLDSLDSNMIIGVDESGVGDYLTPLVAAAVFVKPEDIAKLKKLGVQDSKKLSDDKILALAPKIRELTTYHVNHLTQKGYNTLNKYMNAHELKMFSHLKSINFIENKIKDINKYYVVIDKYSTTKTICEYYEKFMQSTAIQTFPIKAEVILVEKAESHSIAVAAASILAREKLLILVKEQNEELEMEIPLGTNEIVEKAALLFIEKFGRKNLYNIAKIKFKTTEKLDEILANNK
ncbi:MAG: ribonuclease HIII [Metamycoplasmataceae bacterium]